MDRLAAQVREPDGNRIHRRGHQRGRERAPRRRRCGHRVDQHEDGDPGQVQHPRARLRRPTVQHRDQHGVDDHRHETDVALRARTLGAVPHVEEKHDREGDSDGLDQLGPCGDMAGHHHREAGDPVHHVSDNP